MTFVHQPMEMTGLINITQETSPAGAALKKSSGSHYGWDATASSSECIESLQSSRRGLRCRLSDAYRSNYHRGQHFMIGLMNMDAVYPQHLQQGLLRNSVEYESISYAAYIYGGIFYIFESGKKIDGEFGTVQAGDVIDIRLTREELPKIEYRVNGTVLHTSSEGPPKQVRLFGKVCAAHQSPLVEGLQWILEDPPPQIAELQTTITEEQTCITEQQTQIAELQTRIAEQQAAAEQQKKEMKAGSDALLVVTKENAQLLVRLESAREASQAASEAKVESLEAVVEQQKKEMKEMKAELAAEKENSSAIIEEQSSRLARLQAEMDALQEASRPGANLQQAKDTVGCQNHCKVPENLHLSPMKLDSLEEELLGVLVAKAKLEVREMQLRRAVNANPKVPAEMCHLQQTQPQEDSERNRALLEDKAQLEKKLKAVTEQNERLQRQQAESEELHCLFKHMGQAIQCSNTRAASKSSEAGSDPWELLGSDGPASSAAADES